MAWHRVTRVCRKIRLRSDTGAAVEVGVNDVGVDAVN